MKLCSSLLLRPLRSPLSWGGFLLLFAGEIAGQAPLSPRVKSFGQKEHQGHYQILSVEPIEKGGVWFGTAEVLLHYNGEKWDHHHLGDGYYARDIEEDEKGRIWVAANKGFGYMKIVPPEREEGEGPDSAWVSRIGDMVFEPLHPNLPDSAPPLKEVSDAHPMGDRVFFQGGNGLYVQHPEGIEVFRPNGDAFADAWGVDSSFFIQDPGRGLYRIDRGDLPLPDGGELPESLLVPGSERIKGWAIRGLAKDVPGLSEEGELLLNRGGQGLFRSHPDADSLRIHPLGEGKGVNGQSVRMHHMLSLLDHENQGRSLAKRLEAANTWQASLAVGTLTKGELLVDTNGALLDIIGRKDGFPASFIWDSEKGPQGSGLVWSATNKGIALWHPGDPRSYSLEGRGMSRAIHDVLRYRERLTIATSEGVFYRKAGDRDKVQDKKVPWEKVRNTNEHVQDMILSPGNGDERKLWMGGLNHLLKLQLEGGDRQASEVLAKDPYQLDTISFGKKGGLLLFAGNDGVVVMDPRAERELLHLKGFPKKAVSLKSEHFEGKDGGRMIRVWVGVRAPVIFCFELPLKALERAERNSLDLSKVLKGKAAPFRGVRIPVEAAGKEGVEFYRLDGGIVIGTDNGLFRSVERPMEAWEEASSEKESWRRVFRPERRFGCRFTQCDSSGQGRMIFRLNETEEGEVWLRSQGVNYHFVPDGNGAYRVDSLPFRGTGIGAYHSYFCEGDGITWIGGSDGLMRYDAKVEKDFERDFPCLIGAVSVSLTGAEREKRGKADSLIHRGFYRRPAPKDTLLGWERAFEQPGTDIQALPYRFNGLSFRFAAPYFDRQGTISYSYKLVPFNKKWSPYGSERRKEYTSLAPGSYTFKVRARNIYGVESEIATYRFKILPPWYRTWTAYGGYGVAGAALIWLLLWLNGRRLRAQKEKLEQVVQERTQEIQEQKETIEEAHRDITKSIDYAQKIQQALLRSEDEAASTVPEHFILFKPQAKVSGDFYWFKEEAGFIYIAAVDCTGHGVPGAFMSMLGISQLNELMHMKGGKAPSPGALLTELRERVVRELSGVSGEDGAKDGMDAALLKIPITQSPSRNETEVEVRFAGAQNPLYVVREGVGEKVHEVSMDQQGEEREGQGGSDPKSGPIKPFKQNADGIEVKGDPMPVGYDERSQGNFKTVRLRLKKGDMLYIFSDGFADQFGGEKGKKFRYGPFKRLLADIHEKPVEEQRQELDRTFEQWKGKQEQIDDVVVIGLRL